jgi:hypothetical protein
LHLQIEAGDIPKDDQDLISLGFMGMLYQTGSIYPFINQQGHLHDQW